MSEALVVYEGVRGWHRWGTWSAHFFVDGLQQCSTQHTFAEGGIARGLERHPPQPAELAPSGLPYGKVCQRCVKLETALRKSAQASAITDTFVRKAQTMLPGGRIVERDWTAAECFKLYRDGWTDGAAIHAMRKTHVGLGPYERGYADGRKARNDACEAEAKRVGYEPTILRACATKGDGR